MLIAPVPAGATLGVIAPAGPPKPGQLEQVPALLEAHGFRAKIFPGCAGPTHLGFLAASDAQRLADLHAAFADPEVDAVLCLRGGYGCARLLDRIDTALLRAHPKLLIGFSDITSLHSLRDRLGLPGLHGPMPASNLLGAENAGEAQRLFDQLKRGCRSGDLIAPEMTAHPLNQGSSASGRLIGGNLAVFTALLGTPWAPQAEGAILFIEDVGEEPYRVDRLLAQLRLAGVLDAAAGFLIGSFTGCEESPDAVLADCLLPLGKPVLAGWPSGHRSPNVALPLGVNVELDVAQRCLILR